MRHSEGQFTGTAGRTLYHQAWEPDANTRALFVVVHGAGEHGGRYEAFAQFFTQRGIAVAALDHHGHGRSEGRYGHADSFDDYLLDLHQWRESLNARFSGVPMFLVGHSMGGLVSGSYLVDHQSGFAGAIFSGALLVTPLQPGAVQNLLIKVLAVLLPRLGVLKLDPGNVCRDPEIVRAYVQDPLVYHGSISVRMLRELFAAIDKLKENANRLILPMLIMHGSEDSLTSPEGSRLLHKKAGSIDKELAICPGLYHEIFNEPEREEVLQQVLTWCEKRLPPA